MRLMTLAFLDRLSAARLATFGVVRLTTVPPNWFVHAGFSSHGYGSKPFQNHRHGAVHQRLVLAGLEFFFLMSAARSNKPNVFALAFKSH
jgi:hypothetical protein